MSAESDILIISDVLRGNTQAFAQLVDRYQQYVFTLAYRLIPNREDAEEIAQDSFVKAFRYLADFRQESKFSTWLYTIVQRNAISFLRKKQINIQPIDNKEFLIPENNNTLNTLQAKSDKQMINEALSLLKPEDSSILSLFYLQEQSLEEIGQILGIETGAAKVRLFRARQKMKQVIESNFAELKQSIH
ncbi:MAG: RNA polymerase subunit sigma [Pseudopedobacter saltans]|uniref:RNA polymerase sigma factor n=1 Tax=Pseudopedobacter saltans TaxID=151895 RepID=A0A2W5F2S7_9SPHI|nr:MAG: RNA polymerase subunit sigma [Pseudopedobacter saltans]